MRCPYCQKENPDRAKFCTGCGRKLELVQQPEVKSQNAQTAETKDQQKAAPKGQQRPEMSNPQVTYQNPAASGPKPSNQKPKKKKSGCLVILAVFLVFVLVVSLFSCGGSSEVEVYEEEEDESLEEIVEETEEVTYERDESLITADAGNMQLLDLTSYDLTAADSEEALTVIDGLTGALNIDSSDELVLMTERSFNGTSYYRFQQVYNDLTVIGHSIVLTADESGSVQLLTENLADMSETETEAQISADDAIETALAYLEAQAAEDGDEDYETPDETAYELCYYVSDTDGTVLAYAVMTESSTVYVSAETGDVLDENDTTSSLTGYNSDGTIEIPVSQDDEGYYLYDEERDLNVFTLDGTNSQKNKSPSKLYSDNLYFGDTEEEEEREYEAGIAWYQMIREIYDFYLDNFGEDGFGGTILFYNDSFDSGNNALGGFKKIDGVLYNYLSIGSEWNDVIEDSVDVMAHEFTHAMSKAIIGTDFPDGNEAGALTEGLADIMGVLIEASIAGSDPDWTMELLADSYNRYAYNPKISNYDDYEDSLDSHDAGTLLFYCAYLMWETSGDGIEAIDDVGTMAELWYRTMLLMNTDATFADCRLACEAAAAQMELLGLLSEEQVNAVAYAFDTCGIEYTASLSISPEESMVITVYDGDGEETDDFQLVVKNQEGVVTDEMDGSEWGSSFKVTFGEEGVYQLTVSRAGSVYPSVSATVTVGYSTLLDYVWASDETLDFHTTFGTNLFGNVTDENMVVLEGVTVTAVNGYGLTYVTSQDSISYHLEVPVGVYTVTYEKDGYEPVTVEANVGKGSNQIDTVVMTKVSVDETAMYQAYYDKLVSLSSSAGDGKIVDLSDGEWGYLSGLCYAELKDIDDDDLDELLLAWLDAFDSTYEIPSYTVEIWDYTIDDGLVQIYSGSEFQYNGDACSIPIYIRYGYYYMMSGGTEDFAFYGPSEDGTYTLFDAFEYDWDTYVWTIDGDEVSDDEYVESYSIWTEKLYAEYMLESSTDDIEETLEKLEETMDFLREYLGIEIEEEEEETDQAYQLLLDYVNEGKYPSAIAATLGAYASFDELLNDGYEPYYVITDLNADGNSELLICAGDGMGFYFTWLFVYDGSDVVLVDDYYGYGQFRYSSAYNAVVVPGETKSSVYYVSISFYQIDGTVFNWLFSIIYDGYDETTDEMISSLDGALLWYYCDSSGNSLMDTTYSDSEYSQDIEDLEWISLES